MLIKTKELKKQKLKAVVNYIICQNAKIYSVIKSTKDVRSGKFRIQLNEDNNSYGNKNDCHIIIGVGNLEKLFDICSSFCQTYHVDYRIDRNVFCLSIDDDLDIDVWDIKEEHLDKFEFLDNKCIGGTDILVLNAFAFTLYHEFGHVKYDDCSKLPIENEMRADLFAFEVVKDKCSNYSEIDVCDSPFFIGALLELVLTLKVCDSLLMKDDASHPHPIKRLYRLMDFFHIKEDSYLWEYIYNIVVDWFNDNNVSMFVKESSPSFKEKMLDTYHRLKK